MTVRRRVLAVSLAAAAAGTLAVAFAVSGAGGRALSLDASAAQSVAARASSAASAAPANGSGTTNGSGTANGSGTSAGSGSGVVPYVAAGPQATTTTTATATPTATVTPTPAPTSKAPTGAITSAPQTPPARICGNTALLSGPSRQPSGSVRVPAGNDKNINFRTPHTTYWFAPGVHYLGTGVYDNIDPGTGSSFIGGPGAIIDGQHRENSAFDDNAADITISHLTIRNFGTWGGGQQEGVVNHDSGSDWTITHSSIVGNAGAGVMLGSGDTLSYDCLQDNQQYGFSAFSNSGTVFRLVLDHNEIAGNDSYNFEARYPGCGCSGGGKFWHVINAVVTNNWVVNNRSVGLWADTDNAGFEFAGNYIQNSQGVALQYEISYNALIEYNTFAGNGIASGPTDQGFPMSTIYLSESGSDSRVKTNYRGTFLIAHNNFVNNWGGVILWENSNRFCGSPDNSSTAYCTIVDPKATLQTCGNPADIKKAPYLGDCRWKTQNVLVEDNTFSLNPSAVGKACTVANYCGFNGVFSEFGSLSPYQGDVIPTNIAYHRNNHFTGNHYTGPWCFMAWQEGNALNWNQWRAAVNENSHRAFGEDAGGSYTGANPNMTC